MTQEIRELDMEINECVIQLDKLYKEKESRKQNNETVWNDSWYEKFKVLSNLCDMLEEDSKEKEVVNEMCWVCIDKQIHDTWLNNEIEEVKTKLADLCVKKLEAEKKAEGRKKERQWRRYMKVMNRQYKTEKLLKAERLAEGE